MLSTAGGVCEFGGLVFFFPSSSCSSYSYYYLLALLLLLLRYWIHRLPAIHYRPSPLFPSCPSPILLFFLFLFRSNGHCYTHPSIVTIIPFLGTLPQCPSLMNPAENIFQPENDPPLTHSESTIPASGMGEPIYCCLYFNKCRACGYRLCIFKAFKFHLIVDKAEA